MHFFGSNRVEFMVFQISWRVKYMFCYRLNGVPILFRKHDNVPLERSEKPCIKVLFSEYFITHCFLCDTIYIFEMSLTFFG